MVAVPEVIPLTTPVAETVAMPVALLLHDPPVTASASVLVAPSHIDTGDDGVMEVGELTTVTVVVAEQLPEV